MEDYEEMQKDAKEKKEEDPKTRLDVAVLGNNNLGDLLKREVEKAYSENPKDYQNEFFPSIAVLSEGSLRVDVLRQFMKAYYKWQKRSSKDR